MSYCIECGHECKPEEECFYYAGTHCTNGKSGTHYTGTYVSDCCGAEVREDQPERGTGMCVSCHDWSDAWGFDNVIYSDCCTAPVKYFIESEVDG